MTNRFLACLCSCALAGCLTLACDSRSSTRPTTPGQEATPGAAVDDGLAPQVQSVRDAVTKLLGEDKEAPAKLLSFFLHGEDEFLRLSSRDWNRAYAEELVFLELVFLPHTDPEWDMILNHRYWLQAQWGMLYPEKVWPLDQGKLDRRWTIARLESDIRSLAGEDGNVIVAALREIRIYDQLDLIPKSHKDSLDRGMKMASATALGSTGTGVAIHLLHLMEERISYPPSLSSFLWNCARNPYPELRAQALLVGPHYSSDEKDIEKLSQRWRQHLVSALADSDSRVVHSALIAIEDSYIDLSVADRVEIASLAFRVLLDAALHESNPRLLWASISILSTQPYGDENPSEDQWWKVVSPLLGSSQPAIRQALPALALHRYPNSQAAHETIAALTGDGQLEPRYEVFLTMSNLLLGPKDIPWLKKFLPHKDPVLRILAFSALAYATDWKLGQETSELLLESLEENLGQADMDQVNRLSIYLNIIVQCRVSPESWRAPLLRSVNSRDLRNRSLARIALAAHGWFPDDEVDELRSSLTKAKGEDRDSILLALYLVALKKGRLEAASHLLDQIFAHEDGDSLQAIHFALEAGGMTEQQKQAAAMRLADHVIINELSLSEREIKLWATLGSAWKPYIGDVELYMEMAQEDTQAKATDWFVQAKKARILSKLLEAIER